MYILFPMTEESIENESVKLLLEDKHSTEIKRMGMINNLLVKAQRYKDITIQINHLQGERSLLERELDLYTINHR